MRSEATASSALPPLPKQPTNHRQPRAMFPGVPGKRRARGAAPVAGARGAVSVDPASGPTEQSLRVTPSSTVAMPAATYVDLSSTRGDASEFSGCQQADGLVNAVVAPPGDSAARRLPRDPSVLLTGSTAARADESLRKYLQALENGLVVSSDRSGGDSQREFLTWASHPPMGLYAFRHLGLVISLVFASMMTSCLKRGVLPIMKGEFLLEAHQVEAAEVLLMLPWSSMLVVGFASDALPIFNSHRKSYMILGWTLTSAALYTMALLNYTQEYDQRIHNRDPSISANERIAVINGYLFLLGVACFGGIVSVIIGEVYLIGQSTRECLAQRGEIIGTYLMTQFFFEGVGQVLTDYVIFQTTNLGVQPLFSLRNIIIFLSFYATVPIVALIVLFKEADESPFERMKPPPPSPSSATTASRPPSSESWWQRTRARIQRHLGLLWEVLSRPSTWAIVLFLAILVFFSEFTVKYPHQVLDELCHVTAQSTSSGKIIAEAFGFLAVFLWRFFCLNESWMVLAGLSILGVWVPQMIVFPLELLSGTSIRSPELHIAVGALRNFLRAVIIIIETAMAIEIAPAGAEGATLGTLVSTATILRLLSTTVSSLVGFGFGAHLVADHGLRGEETVAPARDGAVEIALTTEAQRRVLVGLAVCFAGKFLASAAVFLPTPAQKLPLQVALLNERGPTAAAAHDPRYARRILGLLLGSLVVAVAVNLFIVTPGTSCLRAFGGHGCESI